MVLSDGRPAAGASIVLGDNNSNISTLDQGVNYYYTTTTDANGVFSFDNVRSATYGLHAWGNGYSISDITTTYTQNNISVKNDGTTSLGTLSWRINTHRNRIFQIGTLDHTTHGFHFGGAPYEHALVTKCPANLTYIIGTSLEDDWCFGQSTNGSWTVLFDIAEQDAILNKIAVLMLSFAGYSKWASLTVRANERLIESLEKEDLDNGPGLYRSTTTAGEWRFFEVEIGVGVLVQGRNSIIFEISSFALWRGFMWDSVVLEWGS